MTPSDLPAPAPPTGDEPETRARYRHLLRLQTRWMDNDIYGHVNNVVYYSYFDTLINRYLIERGALDIRAGAVIGLAVETRCQFRRPLGFPGDIDGALRVAHLGRSSVRYEIALFAEDSQEPAALGTFVHVFVDRATRRPVPIPEALRAALSLLLAPTGAASPQGGAADAPRRPEDS